MRRGPRPSPSPSPGRRRRHPDRGDPGHRRDLAARGQTVTTAGRRHRVYPTGGLNGFYIQTPGADTADASDAIFVYGGASGFTTLPGGRVTRSSVTGTVAEFSGAHPDHRRPRPASRRSPHSARCHPKTQIPGTDCALPGTACLTGAALDDAREVVEGELFQPTAPWTATDVYDGAPSTATAPTRRQPRRDRRGGRQHQAAGRPDRGHRRAGDGAGRRAQAYNNAHRIILDDGSSTNYTTAEQRPPFPWFTADHTRRASARRSPSRSRSSSPGLQRVADPADQRRSSVRPPATHPQFAQTRAATPPRRTSAATSSSATFNVLNFFPTTGERVRRPSASAPARTSATARATRSRTTPATPTARAVPPTPPTSRASGTRSSRRSTPPTPTSSPSRSSRTRSSSARTATSRSTSWSTPSTPTPAPAPGPTCPSPAAADLPTAEQDVIRTGFIYQPANVALVGESVVLATSRRHARPSRRPRAAGPGLQAGRHARRRRLRGHRQPLQVQGLRHAATPTARATPTTGRDRSRPHALVTFADDVQDRRAASHASSWPATSTPTREEDPIQILKAAGYTNLESTSDPDEETYNFDGQVGSLDHVLANALPWPTSTAVDIWADQRLRVGLLRVQPLQLQRHQPLRRHNPFRSSDHNPEIVGIDVPPVDADAPATIQILATNDFHGRLAATTPAAPTAGAAVLAGAVKSCARRTRTRCSPPRAT